jgi:thiopeptide-type bacteriocin biosynthesis protein
LNAEVRPRLTTAHNPAWRGFGVYRFLAALQRAGVAGALGWDWGALAGAPTLPRVTAGRLVLARARWQLSTAEVSTVTGSEAADGWSALARDRGLPRELLIADGDNRLYVDTASPALISAAAKVLRGRAGAVVEEVLPDGVATGPQGRFTQELIVPFTRRTAPASAPQPWRAPQVQRTFAPGSEWLYVKVYTGTASADRILTDTIGPAIGELRDRAVFDEWFFLRYADPEHHLRLRLHGDPAALRDHALPALTDALTAHLNDGTVSNVALDTYHREIERYGGDEGIELAERVHAVDSDAVLNVLGMFDGDDMADARWKLCLYATDRLLADAGLDTQQRRDWVKNGAAGYRSEYPGAHNLDSGIGARWRTERAELTTLLDDTADHSYESARQVFRQRSEQLAPLLAELADRGRRGLLTQPFEHVLRSFSHLNAIRLLRSSARTHELVLLSFLDRYYASQIARTRQESSKRSS